MKKFGATIVVYIYRLQENRMLLPGIKQLKEWSCWQSKHHSLTHSLGASRVFTLSLQVRGGWGNMQESALSSARCHLQLVLTISPYNYTTFTKLFLHHCSAPSRLTFTSD